MIFDPTGKEKRLMTDSSSIYRYIHAGKGEVTLVSPMSLKAHSYLFKQPADSGSFPADTIFVYVIHEGHSMYIGMLDNQYGFRLTNKSAFGEHTEAVKGARYIVKMASNQNLVDKRSMLLYHSGRCCKCGRLLRSDKALKLGIGRCCIKFYEELSQKEPWDGNK